MAVAADQTFKAVVSEAIRKRAAVRTWLDHGGGIEGAFAGLCGALGVGTDDSIERIQGEITDGPLLPASQWATAAAMLQHGSKSDQEQAQRLRVALGSAGSERAEIYLQLWPDDHARAAQERGDQGNRDPLSTACRASLCRTHPRPGAGGAPQGRRLPRPDGGADHHRRCRHLLRYQAAKDRRGLLDYDDLIDKTLALLGEERAGWVHYKLDRGIDHVLIDEAQDTSLKQWEIIRRP